MKVYFQPPQPSRGLQRIADALTKHRPEWMEVVGTEAEADLVVIYAIGRRERIERQCEHLLSTGRKYAVIQVCLRSTMSPDTRDWARVWKRAATVWSYYDLKHAAEMDEDGAGAIFSRLVNFYHAPLGADTSVFKSPFINPRWDTMPHQGRNFMIATSGASYLTESVRECWVAAQAVDGEVFHVGMPTRRLPSLKKTFSAGCDDRELALHYAASRFVSGLRRVEGFELPAVEGLLCGARPIVFDTPDYHWNYGEHAEYIHEGSRQEVVDQLVELFRQGARPVTTEERAAAAERFNWATIIKGFYDRLQ